MMGRAIRSRRCVDKNAFLTRAPSVAEEHWTALLDEGGYPFLSVMRRHDPRKSRLLDGEPVVDRGIHAAVDGGQGRGERQGRLAGKLRREAKGGAEKVVPRN